MKILWLTWKDKKNPQAGGAEIVNEELAKRLSDDGHEVIFLVAGFKNGLHEESISGYKIVRLGNQWTVYWKAYRYYKKNLKGWADLAIDEVNTIPFFAKFYCKEKNLLFFHQLCRQIWFYQIFFPLNLIGYLLEPIYLWLLRNQEVITVSESTKNDLQKYGFKNNQIKIISEGIEIKPVESFEQIQKYDQPTILSFGSVRAMKRTDHIIKAFEKAKNKINNLELIIAGDTNSKYGQKTLKMVSKSPYKDSIKKVGTVNSQEKIKLMQRSYIICVTSVKEGWGLIVTEANSQGTPAIVYNVDGLRDSVKNNQTGIICRINSPEYLGNSIIDLIKNQQTYEQLRINAWKWSKQINFEKSYRDFFSLINKND